MNRSLFLALACSILLSDTLAQVRFGRQFRSNQDDDKLEINYTNPKEYEIAEINVRGAEFLDENALISLSGLKVGDKIKVPGEDITFAIRKLWSQGIIGDVSVVADKVENGQIYLTIVLKERPRLSNIVLDGINKTQQSDLNDKIKLIRGRVLTDALIKNAELTVKKYFIEKGYLNTEVKVSQLKDTLLANSVQLKITVDKKRKVKINEILFTGNKAFTDNKLKNKMKNTNEKVRLDIISDLFNKLVKLIFHPSELKKAVTGIDEVEPRNIKKYVNKHVKLNIFKPSKFSKTTYEEDKKSLITFYNSKGYRDATIVSDSVYKNSSRTINVNIKVDEGRKYYFRDIIWTGNYIYTDEMLDRILGVEKGDVYDLDLINKRLNFNPVGEDITSLYMDNGYLAFQIEPVEVQIDGDSIDVEMRMREGGVFTVNDVIIRGNTKTNEHVIRREIRTLPGQKFSRARIIRTNRELAQLGFFDPEKIDIAPMPNMSSNTVDIQYTVEERPNDQLELSGGFGGSFGFVGTLGVVFNNFSVRNIPHFDKWRPLPVGDGQKLALRAQANGRAFQNYSLSFSEPWLGGNKPNSFSISLTRSIQRSRASVFGPEGIFLGTSRNDFDGSLKLSGITLGLGRRVEWPDNNFTLLNSISYFLYDLDNFSNSLGFRDGNANSIAFTTTISRNTIDNPMYPRTGSQLSLAATFTPPYSLFRDLDFENASNAEKFEYIEYHKWMFDAKFYIPIVGKLVLESRAHLGFLGSYTDKAGIGPFERFLLGGSGLSGQNFILGTDVVGLRGYDDNSVVPIEGRDERMFDDNGDVIGEDKRIRGGVVFNKYVMELRYPLSLNPSATVYVLGFAEAGNTWNNYEEFDPGSLFKSVGFGARVFMPAFGLLGIDWGHAIDTSLGGLTPAKQTIQFRIGQQIR